MPVQVEVKRIGFALPLLGIFKVVAACSNGAVADFRERPGREGIYARIESLTDRIAFQGEFDAAQTNLGRGVDVRLTTSAESYAQVAMDRMEELNCEEDSPKGEQS